MSFHPCLRNVFLLERCLLSGGFTVESFTNQVAFIIRQTTFCIEIKNLFEQECLKQTTFFTKTSNDSSDVKITET